MDLVHDRWHRPAHERHRRLLLLLVHLDKLRDRSGGWVCQRLHPELGGHGQFRGGDRPRYDTDNFTFGRTCYQFSPGYAELCHAQFVAQVYERWNGSHHQWYGELLLRSLLALQLGHDQCGRIGVRFHTEPGGDGELYRRQYPCGIAQHLDFADRDHLHQFGVGLSELRHPQRVADLHHRWQHSDK